MNKRVIFMLEQIQKNSEVLVTNGGVISFILAPIASIILKLHIDLVTLVLTIAILYTVVVILYYAWKAKKEVN